MNKGDKPLIKINAVTIIKQESFIYCPTCNEVVDRMTGVCSEGHPTEPIGWQEQLVT